MDKTNPRGLTYFRSGSGSSSVFFIRRWRIRQIPGVSHIYVLVLVLVLFFLYVRKCFPRVSACGVHLEDDIFVKRQKLECTRPHVSPTPQKQSPETSSTPHRRRQLRHATPSATTSTQSTTDTLHHPQQLRRSQRPTMAEAVVGEAPGTPRDNRSSTPLAEDCPRCGIQLILLESNHPNRADYPGCAGYPESCAWTGLKLIWSKACSFCCEEMPAKTICWTRKLEGELFAISYVFRFLCPCSYNCCAPYERAPYAPQPGCVSKKLTLPCASVTRACACVCVRVRACIPTCTVVVSLCCRCVVSLVSCRYAVCSASRRRFCAFLFSKCKDRATLQISTNTVLIFSVDRS